MKHIYKFSPWFQILQKFRTHVVCFSKTTILFPTYQPAVTPILNINKLKFPAPSVHPKSNCTHFENHLFTSTQLPAQNFDAEWQELNSILSHNNKCYQIYIFLVGSEIQDYFHLVHHTIPPSTFVVSRIYSYTNTVYSYTSSAKTPP